MNKPLVKTDLSTHIEEIKLDKTIQNFLERRGYEEFDIEKMEVENSSDIEFVKISHISYDRLKDESDLHLIDFQQILSAIASHSQKFVYMIEGTTIGVNLYLGCSSATFLKDTFEGVYSGSEVLEEKPAFDENYTSAKAMMGIPALKRDSDKSFKQTLEKILFPMQGKEFRITLVAEAYQLETIQEIISNFQTLGNELHRFVKQTKNMQKSNAHTDGSSKSDAVTEGTSTSEAKTEGSSRKALKGVLLPMIGLGTAGAFAGANDLIGGKLGGALHEIAPELGTKFGKVSSAGTGEYGDLWETIKGWGHEHLPFIGDHDTYGKMVESGADTLLGPLLGSAIGLGAGAVGGMVFGKTLSSSTTETKTRTNSTTKTDTVNSSDTTTQLQGITFDEINKSAEYCEETVDKYIERFQKGLNHGMWNSSLYIEAKDDVTLGALEHTLKSVYSGDETFYETIRFSTNFYEKDKDIPKNLDFDMQNLPMLYTPEDKFRHPMHLSFSGFSTAINTEELSILATIPSNDIDGISVSKVSSFGLTQAKASSDGIEIGNILNKKRKINQRFFLSKDAINSHMFVSGITGSGKSNTIKLILEQMYHEYKIPFLVIEPAKSEYKHLLNSIDDLQIFRPGAKDDIFKLNPFVFDYTQDENSTTLIQHVDMLKTTFSSAFPMYGPMPYILEEAIHKVYEAKGWSFDTQHHDAYSFTDAADVERKSMLFPTMADLKNEIDSVVESAGYHQELENNIKAALKTRINNLTIGAKGKIFNSKHAFSDEILFDKPTVIELSNIVDDEEKSFLMGLLLNKLYKYRVKQSEFNELKHVTVIEEAHRLLPNIAVSNNQEASDTKAKAVETFTHILAEIRSFGEGIIVADQIASKLHQDVIKNTNVKILHRTMAKDDRDIIGNSINLTDDQILDISELKTGEAIVHNKDVHQAFMVHIDEKPELKINHIQIEEFYDDFLTKYENYKYELIGEKSFYQADFKVNMMSVFELKDMKLEFINFLNSVFDGDIELVKTLWVKLYDNFDFKQKEVIYYQLMYLWKELSFIGNYEYYADIDNYMQTTKNFTRLIKALNDNENIDKYVKRFQKSFEHENIKVVYPAMKEYNDESIDYTLILVENFFNDQDFINFHNEVFSDISLNCREKIAIVLNKIFIKPDIEMNESLISMKLKLGKVNIENIKKECV